MLDATTLPYEVIWVHQKGFYLGESDWGPLEFHVEVLKRAWSLWREDVPPLSWRHKKPCCELPVEKGYLEELKALVVQPQGTKFCQQPEFLEKNPELQMRMQAGQQLDCSLMKPWAENPKHNTKINVYCFGGSWKAKYSENTTPTWTVYTHIYTCIHRCVMYVHTCVHAYVLITPNE